MRLLLDTSLLLNDFFHRNPAVAEERSGRPAPDSMRLWWQLCHECLLSLSLKQDAYAYVLEYVTLRLVSVLSDLQLPSAAILEELEYWNANFKSLPFTPQQAEEALRKGIEKSSEHPFTEDHLLVEAAKHHKMDGILTPVQRPVRELSGIRFYHPNDLMPQSEILKNIEV